MRDELTRTWRVAMVGMLLVLLGVLMTGCVGQADEMTIAPGGDDCPVLVIENQNFADVHVYLTEKMESLGRVTGLTTSIVRMCRHVDAVAELELHAVGGAFGGVLQNAGAPRFVRGGVYHLVIAGYAPSSQLYGSE